MDRSQRLGSAGSGWRSPRGGSPAPSPREFRRDSGNGSSLGDSKGGQGIHATIQQLAHEQERVQTKTFTNWINSYLIKRVPPVKVDNLFNDIKDGTVLLALLETLSGEKLPGEKGAKLKRVHYVSNISNALRFLESKKIKLVNINPSDIADGKPAIVLGLIWTIILYFQIEETATRLAEQQAASPSKKMSPLEKFRVSAKKALMQWTEQAISNRYGLNIKDFGKSWRDGVAFNAMIDNISPGLVDMDQVRQQTPRVNLENAFSAAESHLGIARLIDPEDVDVDKPDEKSIMTYVAQFMKAYPDSGEDPANRKSPPKTLSPEEQEQKNYDDMLSWLQQAQGTLEIVNKPVTDVQKEYMDYLKFKKDYDIKEEEYRKIGQRIESNQALKLNDGNWRILQSQFLPVSENTVNWLVKLDSHMPGKLGHLGAWLVEAQRLIGQEPEMIDNPEEMSAQLGQMLQTHIEFFKDGDAYKRLLSDVKRSGKYDGKPVCAEHITDLQKRFTEIQSQANLREKRLSYELQKNKLLTLLDMTEEKLERWQEKYGREEEVLQLLNEYKDVVVDKRLVQSYDKNYSELKSKADTFKKDNPSEKSDVERNLQSISDRWRALLPQVKGVQPVLEEGVASWKRYNTSLDWLEKWIGEGENVLLKSTEEKQAYFKDVKPVEDKLKVLRDSGSRLSEKTQEPVAREIRDNVEDINVRYEDLLGNMKHAHQVEVVEKGRSEYTSGIERLEAWVKKTEELLNKTVPCHHADLKEYLALLEATNGEIPQVEADFKTTTKTAQSLVRESSGDDVNKMLQTLNVHKETIVKLRKEVPERLKSVKAIVPNVESLENGVIDLSVWLEDGEKLLNTHQLEGDAQSADERLEKHKTFFAETTYQKSILESKNKVFQKVMSSKPKLPNVDFSVLENSMGTLQSGFQELLDKGEESVSQHQEYQEASNSFVTWLRAAREKLVTCSDTFGDKAAIIAKIDKAKSLSQNLSEGTKKLMDSTVSGEATLPNTSPQGQSKIKQELEETKTDFDEYKSQLTSAQSQLEGCLTKWNEFEDGYQSFGDWLNDTEDYLKHDPELKSTVEEKKDNLIKYQRYHDEVKARQNVLDTVNEKAQALLKTNADAKLSHAITQLTTKYQGMLSLSKDTVKKLEGCHGDHKGYKVSLEDFSDWLKDAKVKLQQMNDTSGSKDDVNSRLEQIRSIQAVLDQGQSKLRNLLDNADKTMSNTNEAGCQIIRRETDTMKAEYEKLKSETTTAKRGLEDTLSHWGDFDRVYDQLRDWMTETETKLKSQPDLKADLPEKRSCLEKYRAILGDVEAHRDLIDKLEGMSSQLQDPSAVATLSELRERYQALLATGKDGVEKMEEEVTCHEEYRKAYNESVDWLSEAKRKLQRLNDTSGDCKSLESRLQAIQEFNAEMKRGEALMNKTAELGEKLRLSTAPKGQDLIGQEIQTLKDDWHTFNVAMGEVEGNLETGVSDWKQYELEYNDLHLWLERSDEKVKALLIPQSDLTSKQQILSDGQALYDEITDKKSALDSVREEADSVSHRSSDPRVSTNVMQLSTKYQTLNTAAKSMVHRLKENASDHEAYNDSYDDCLHWLDMTHQRLKDCGDSSADWQTLGDKMELIKDITSSMEEGLQKVNRCCDLAEKIIPHTGVAGKKTIEEEITKLTQDWEDINREINDCSGILEGAQSKWHEYEKYYGSFVKWMTETEGVLALEPEPKAQLVEKKTQLDKYKLILSDVENHEQLLTELGESVSNLESMGDNPDVSDSLLGLQSRYDRLRNNAQDTVDELERGYAEHLDYQEAQQDCEKWLLQTSFRLMSHNALNVSTLELTQRQIEKHRALLKEIEDYRSTIELVTDKGRDLLENNPRVPELRQQVESEIKNLEESYMNLQATAVQIKNRLGEVEKKWEEYQSTLNSTDQYLSEEFSDWLESANTNVPDDLQDAHKQLETTKNMHEKLTTMKQELSSAAQRCENLGGTESTGQIPSNEESAITVLSAQVNEEMVDSIEQVESRMSKLRDVISQWESVERQRTELRNWLHYKQEEVHDLEDKTNKLHPEAAELEISKLQALREEVVSKGPLVEGFVDRYRTLTQHKPALADPVIRALKDDWEELVGQVDNLIVEKEMSLQHAQDYQSRHNDTEEDLDRLARELERIDRMEATMEDKGLQALPPRRRVLKSRGTQTGAPESRRFRRHDGSDHDSDDNNGDGFDHFPGRRPSQQGTASRLVKDNLDRHQDRQQAANLDRRYHQDDHRRFLAPPLDGHRSPSPFHGSRRRPSSRSATPSLKKGSGADGDVVSDTDESGYGDTCTQHASSFDTGMDYSQEDLLSAMSFTPRGAASARTGYDSDDGTVSCFSEYAEPVDPDDLHDVACQTPGYAQTQTPSNFINPSITVEDLNTIRDHLAASQTPTASGTQTKKKKKKRLRSEMLKGILAEVKSIKAEKGLDSSVSEIDTDAMSEISSLKSGPSRSSAKSPGKKSRSDNQISHETPVSNLSPYQSELTSTPATTSARPLSASPMVFPGARFTSPPPLQETLYPATQRSLYGQPDLMNTYPLPSTRARRIGSQDVQAVHNRLEALRNYQLPPRSSQPLTEPQTPASSLQQGVHQGFTATQMGLPMWTPLIPAYMIQPPPDKIKKRKPRPRYHVRDFTRSYDDIDLILSDSDGGRHHRRRNRRDSRIIDNYHLDDALFEAAVASRQLKKMSKKMKNSLRDEILKG